ncbi:MAG: hypothetical protein U9R21_02710 [Candidatus Thermoplasmatota archaeon]|nr:hypothetical protein [Candidatus Thermoplasmatota archaeon]
MGDEETESKEEISKMFVGDNELLSSDEELALHIMHRFNIDRDTMESMPAFEKPLKTLWEEKQK